MYGSRYRAFSREQFDALMRGMGFEEVAVAGSLEHVFQRVVGNGPHPGARFCVRVFSSVDVRSGWSRDVGGDAIRVLLHDTQAGRPVLDWTVHRTENAFLNTRARAREAWGYVMDAAHHCPGEIAWRFARDCGSMMKRRAGKRGEFLGCTAFPRCKATRPLSRAA